MPKDELSNQFLLTAHECSSQFILRHMPFTDLFVFAEHSPSHAQIPANSNLYFSAKKQLPRDPKKRKKKNHHNLEAHKAVFSVKETNRS